MANLQTAKSAASQFGVQPPEGIVAGTPEYDSWVQAWFDNGVNAGDPRFVQMAGGRAAEEAEGGMADFAGAADSSEWMGKRKPTPRELRKWAADQHARYISGDTSAQDEDYERMDDRQLADWIGKHWDAQKGGFFSVNGEKIAKPPDVDSSGFSAYGKGPGGGGGGGIGGGGGYGGGGQPPKPVTVGKQLSMTGDPMQDMLINQYNTAQNSTYGQGMNIFGLGEDRRVGGTGINADIQNGEQTNTAQSLRGGGLWYGQDKDTFGGWDASQNKALAGVKQTQKQNQAAKSYDKGKKNIAAPVWKQPGQEEAAPVVNQDALTKSAPGSLQDRRASLGKRPRNMGGMLYNLYQKPTGF